MPEESHPTMTSLGSRPTEWMTLVIKDRYEVIRELGRGGMSVVYLAKDRTLLDQLVVMKLLLEAQSQDEYVQRKFQQEVEALVRIKHPHVVTVLDRGALPDGKTYLVMEYVEGEPLRSLVKPGGIELVRAATFVRQIGQALAAVHEKGVWHRDIKPENVMIQKLAGGQEHAKLIDFGIAGVRDSRYSQGNVTGVAGSFSYMAPEQFSGNPCAASDIYALGVLAYELVTGQRPYDSKSMQHLVMPDGAVYKPPRDVRSDLPLEAEQAIVRALKFRIEDRWESASAFGEAFAQSIAPLTSAGSVVVPVPTAPKPVEQAPSPAPPKSGPPKWIWAAVAGVAALGGIGAFVVSLDRPSPPPVEKKESKPDPVVLEVPLGYSVTVQKFRNDKPFEAPYRTIREVAVEKGYGLALELEARKTGHLYVVNEGKENTGELSMAVLSPLPGKASGLTTGQGLRLPPGEDWFRLNEAHGQEMLTVIWSQKPVAELEEVVNRPGGGDMLVIKDEASMSRIREWIRKQDRAGTRPNEQAKQTELTAKGPVLVHEIRFEHY